MSTKLTLGYRVHIHMVFFICLGYPFYLISGIFTMSKDQVCEHGGLCW